VPIATVQTPGQNIAKLEVGIPEHENEFRAETTTDLHGGASNQSPARFDKGLPEKRSGQRWLGREHTDFRDFEGHL
jgi:hypothetical protein